MGLSYDIDQAAEQVRIVGTGRLTMPEMFNMVDQAADDPRFRSNFTVVFDIRSAGYTAEMQDGEAFVAALRRRDADFRNRFALVVPESLHVLAKLFCVLARVGGVDRMECFVEMDKALAWCRNSPLSQVGGSS